MEAYILDWFQLVLRWAHMITGVAWIGASFYFIWLDNHLENPPQWKKDKGISGDLWAIHGGGVYEVAKYKMSPERMPETLHWFKWEAYTTWLTGMLLLTAVYYLGADAYLIDQRVADLSPVEAIAIGLGFIFGGWFFYDTLCNSAVAKNDTLLSIILIAFLVVVTYALTHLFSGRGAFIHVGAMIGTMMVGNVFAAIMPGQRSLVAAIEAGTPADPAWGAKAKLRSTHNTYLTLPLLFIMISNHYPMTYSPDHNWLILLAITVITGCVRQFFVLRHKNVVKPILLILPIIGTLILAAVMAPSMPGSRSAAQAEQSASTPAVTIGEVEAIVQQRCATCHSATATDDIFRVAPAGVMLDSAADIKKWAPRILARTVLTHDMPFMNKTAMTDAERQTLANWINAGSSITSQGGSHEH